MIKWINYDQYMNSPEWENKKKQYFQSKMPKSCLGCGARRVQLHHRYYIRLGKEKLTDLVPLCGKCHLKVHKYLKEHNLSVGATRTALKKLFKWNKIKTAQKFRHHDRLTLVQYIDDNKRLIGAIS